jgi:hAT family C-terminal dimerisation region
MMVSARRRRRNVRLTPLDYGQAPETVLSASQKFRVENYLPIIDQFVAELTRRLSSYELLCERFGFLRRLESCTTEEIKDVSLNLVSVYNEDLDDSLANELIQFAGLISSFKLDEDTSISKEHFMYKLIIEKGLKCSFPNVEIVLRMYLVLMVTNCSAERSFSKLKLVKNRLRTSMTHDRLNNLSIMSLESDVLRGIQFDQLIEEFACCKTRKVTIC